MSHQLWTTLIKWNVSPNQIYYLDCCHSKISPTKIIDIDIIRSECQNLNLVDNNNNITSTGLVILNEFETFLVKTKKKINNEVLGENFIAKVKEYRELFPAIRLPSGQLARQSPQELKDKLVWFFKTYPDISWDELLDATEYYVEYYRKQEWRYMATSSYFIKKTLLDKTITSKLADTCMGDRENSTLYAT